MADVENGIELNGSGKINLYGFVSKSEIVEFLSAVPDVDPEHTDIWVKAWSDIETLLDQGGAVTSNGTMVSNHLSDLPPLSNEEQELLDFHGLVYISAARGRLIPFYLGPEEDQTQTRKINFYKKGFNKGLGYIAWSGGYTYTKFVKPDSTYMFDHDLRRPLVKFMQETLSLNGVPRSYPFSSMMMIRQLLRNEARERGLGEIQGGTLADHNRPYKLLR